MKKRKALGKGLSALIPDAGTDDVGSPRFFQCPVEAIEPNPYQPRKDFSGPELEEMVASVRENGIITPLLVSGKDSGYQLIAGERRWRAAQRAGLERVPVIVREASTSEMLELALIENIHRKDLNPIEEAFAYKRLLEETGATHDTIAQRLGRDRSTVTNLLRLLTLPLFVQQDVVEGRLNMGHARVLAGIKSNEVLKALRDAVVGKGLSVRSLEKMAKAGLRKASVRGAQDAQDYYLQTLETKLKTALGTKVELRKKGAKGRIVVHFYSDEELDRLLDLLM